MQECNIDTPPLTVDRGTLVNAWISQTKNLIDCNNQIRGMKQWKEKVVEIKGAN